MQNGLKQGTHTVVAGIDAALRWWSVWLIRLAALALLLMMLHVLADVVGRQVFASPAPATTEVVAYYYMIAVVFLPLPFLELRGRSIAVDLFYGMFPRWMKRVAIVIACVAGIAFWGTLAVKSLFIGDI